MKLTLVTESIFAPHKLVIKIIYKQGSAVPRAFERILAPEDMPGKYMCLLIS